MSAGMDILVEDMVHVVLLPFKIRRQTDTENEYLKQNECLKQIAEFMRNEGKPVWREGCQPRTKNAQPEIQVYQTQAYFHPFVRRFLFDKSGDELIRFYRDDVKNVTIKLSPDNEFEFVVNKCELALFQPDIGVLVLEIQNQTEKSLLLKDAQNLMDRFRRIYPPYFSKGEDCWQGGHCPVEVTFNGLEAGNYQFNQDTLSGGLPDELKQTYLAGMNIELSKNGEQREHYPMAAHWQALLAPFDCAVKGSAKFRIEQLGDDRAPIMTWLAVNELGSISNGDWVRLCFADESGQNLYPYARSFLKDFNRKFVYDRFWYQGGWIDSCYDPSRILNCGYAFSYVGKKDAHSEWPYFSNGENGALATFRNMYVEMGLVAHFQKAALLSASERLSKMVGRNKDGSIKLPDKGEVAEAYNHFIEFTQNFWFDEISPQEQGREIFEMWRKHLRLQEMYEEIRQEIKDLVEYSEMLATSKNMEIANEEMGFARSLNIKVMRFGIAGIIIATVSMLSGMNKPFAILDEKMSLICAWLFLLFVTALVILASYALITNGEKSSAEK